MKFNFVDFSKDLKYAINKNKEGYKDTSLRGLSKEWGLSAPTLSRVLRGKRADIDTVLTICFYTDIELNDFII